MPRQSRGTFWGKAARRRTAWGEGVGGVAVLSIAGTTTGQFLGQAVLPLVEGLTIARIRGRLSLIQKTGVTVGDGFQGAIGIGIATTPAVVAGTGSLPMPIAEADSENWLYWQSVGVHNGLTSGAGSSLDLEIDSKAMRRFPDEMSLYAAIEVTEIGDASVDVFLNTRTLVFLP